MSTPTKPLLLILAIMLVSISLVYWKTVVTQEYEVVSETTEIL